MNISLNGPNKVIRGQPQKPSFSDISRTVANSWMLVEQNVFSFKWPVGQYKEKREPDGSKDYSYSALLGDIL